MGEAFVWDIAPLKINPDYTPSTIPGNVIGTDAKF
jgi:hypothetical protein